MEEKFEDPFKGTSDLRIYLLNLLFITKLGFKVLENATRKPSVK